MSITFDLIGDGLCKIVKTEGAGPAVLNEEYSFTGTFPLTDHTDLGKHTYTFTNGSKTFTGVLTGFSCDCTFETRQRWPNGELGTPNFTVKMAVKAASSDRVDESDSGCS